MKNKIFSSSAALLLAAGCAFAMGCAFPAGSARADSVSDLIDVPGSEWREEQPKFELMIKHTGLEAIRLTVHFTDIKQNPNRPLAKKLQILYKYSATAIEGAKKRLWGDIPYHFFIDGAGKAGECRNPKYQPDTNTYYQRDGHVTIVLEGNAEDGITNAQKKKLYALLDALREKYDVPLSRVGTHKDYAQTDCPGTVIDAAVRDYMKSRGASSTKTEAQAKPPRLTGKMGTSPVKRPKPVDRPMINPYSFPAGPN